MGSLEKVVGRLETSLSRLWKYVESQVGKLREDLSSEIAKAFEKISQLQKYVDSQVQKIRQELKSEISKAFEKISQLQRYVDSQIQRVRDELRSGDRKLSEKISNLQKHFQSELQKLSQKFNSKLEKLSEKISEILRQVESQIEKIREEFRSEVRKLSEKIGDFVRQLNSQFERLKQYLQSQIPTIGAAAAAIAVPIVLGQIASKIAQQITQKIPKVSCRYNSVQVNRAVRASETTQRTTGVINTFLTGTLTTKIDDFITGTFNRLGPIIGPKGIGGWLQAFGKSTMVTKALNALTLITTIHNAAHLSTSLVTTLGDALSVGLAAVGLTDEEDNPIDINSLLGQAANSFMARVVGEERWSDTKAIWQQFNRTYQAAANLVYIARSIGDSTREVAEWTAEQLGKFMNAAKRDGVVGFDAFPWMPEQVRGVPSVIRRLEGLDEAASSVQMVASEVYNVQQEAAELANAREEFVRNLRDLDTKVRDANEPVAIKAGEAESVSLSPPIAESDLEQQ